MQWDYYAIKHLMSVCACVCHAIIQCVNALHDKSKVDILCMDRSEIGWGIS